MLRTLGRWCVKAFLVVTVLSVTFNALTTPPRRLSAPDGSDVLVHGQRIHYARWGTHGSPIVLVPGFAESTISWEQTARLLARDHVVVAIDLPGYGYSQYTGRYGLAAQAAVVDGFVRALNLHRPALVGHSLGAAVVGEVARTHPQDISGVMFADGDAMAPPGGGGRRAMSWVLRSPYATTIYRVVTRWHWLDTTIVRDECGSPCRGLGPDTVSRWMRPLTQGDAESALPAMARGGMPAMTHAAVRSIRTPRGIIWGAKDAEGGGSLTGAQADLGHPRTVVLAGANHLSMLADPAGFADAVRSLVDAWPR